MSNHMPKPHFNFILVIANRKGFDIHVLEVLLCVSKCTQIVGKAVVAETLCFTKNLCDTKHPKMSR